MPKVTVIPCDIKDTSPIYKNADGDILCQMEQVLIQGHHPAIV